MADVSEREENLGKVNSFEDLLEMVGTNGWKNNLIFLATSLCKCFFFVFYASVFFIVEKKLLFKNKFIITQTLILIINTKGFFAYILANISKFSKFLL